jgi:outer membrane protein assembly factor BamB
MFVARFAPLLSDDLRAQFWMAMLFGPALGSLLILIWWLSASRAPWKVIAGHPSMRGAGTIHIAAPLGMVAFVLAVSLLRRKRPAIRTGGALVVAFVGCNLSLAVRTDGMSGAFVLALRSRWSETAEARLLARTPAPASVPPESTGVTRSLTAPEWPGFRGADRASRQRGAKFATDWNTTPPRQLWKIPVGPAWSSFAVAGDLLFTQEQRGPKEVVVCLNAQSGQEIWSQSLETRFYEALGGPGPRATPTLAEGGVFVTGANGAVMRLDPASGAIMWKQELQTVAARTPPMWGFAASPLVTGGAVIVYAGGAGEKGIVAFDGNTGVLRWSAIAGDDSYSSPQLNTIAGEQVVLMLSNEGVRLLNPMTGALRLNYQWKVNVYRALQPHLIEDDTLLLPTGMSTGTRAVRITRSGDQFTAEERWTSRSLKPDFNDFVTYQGHAYGFDGRAFGCVELGAGERKWKGGQYGNGQVLLLETSGLLLVLSEQGRAVLVRPNPQSHVELASFAVLEGKTWNHPVVVGNRLYVRNSQEAACYELPLAAQ